MISTVAFALVAGAGAVASGNPAAAVAGLLGSAGLAVVVGCIVVVLHSPRTRRSLQPAALWLLRLSKRLAGRPAGDPGAIAASAIEQLRSFRLTLPAVFSAFGYALANWVTDALCLAAAIAAIGVPVPWSRLLLVWTAGSTAQSFSPTPYGLGPVDLALIVTLHAAGLRLPDAIGAVLLYRLITFKNAMTAAWIGYRYLRERSRVRSGNARSVRA